MTDESKRALDIPADVAAAAGVPEDLDSSYEDPDYWVPNTQRRRRAGVVWLGAAAVSSLIVVTATLPAGMWVAIGFMVVLGAFNIAAAWDVTYDESAALEIANREVEFAVGHASAAMNFEGFLARPVWNVLVFSADEPPSRRGLVRVEALTGNVIGIYVEDVPAGEFA